MTQMQMITWVMKNCKFASKDAPNLTEEMIRAILDGIKNDCIGMPPEEAAHLLQSTERSLRAVQQDELAGKYDLPDAPEDIVHQYFNSEQRRI